MRIAGYTSQKYTLEIEVWKVLVIAFGKYIMCRGPRSRDTDAVELESITNQPTCQKYQMHNLKHIFSIPIKNIYPKSYDHSKCQLEPTEMDCEDRILTELAKCVLLKND